MSIAARRVLSYHTESRLKNSGFKFAFDPIRCKFKPTQETLQVCEESGTDLAGACLLFTPQWKPKTRRLFYAVHAQ